MSCVCICPTHPQTDAKAAAAILRQFERLPEGYNYFRLHPKGRGMLVARPGGIQPFTFVEEYLGEVHTGRCRVDYACCRQVPRRVLAG